MLWLYLAVIAQLINAIVVLWDKYLVTAKAKPVAYAFYVMMLSGVVVVLLPFRVISMPQPLTLWLPVAIGLTYLSSILFLYKALQVADASDVVPVVGAAASMTSFILSALLIGEKLAKNFSTAFILLVIGMSLMSYFRFNKKVLFYTLAAGFFFGSSLVLTKIVFTYLSFLNGFFWSRMANVFGGLLLLLWPSNRRVIFGSFRTSSSGVKYAVIANKTLAGLAFFLILVSTKLGSVALVNALNGVEFLFLFLLALVFTKKLPQYLYENVKEKKVALHKIAGLSFIISGLAFLFL